MRWAIGLAAATAVTAVTACGPLGPREVDKPRERPPRDALEALARPDAARLAIVERAERGGRLLLVDERGDRHVVVAPPGARDTQSIDLTPAWSPDGRWIAFASSRGCDAPDRWSLWVASAVEPDAAAPLTDGCLGDLHPTWSPDGRALAFASRRDGAFQLWRLDLRMGGDAPPRPGRMRRLTSGPPQAIEPTWSPRGDAIAYVAVNDEGSALARIAPDGGAPRRITDGPADVSPAWTPDGARLVFAAPAGEEGRTDLDLWTARADGADRRRLVNDDLGDERAPVVSADGRFVFAASVVRDDAGGARFASVVFVDLEAAPVLRTLEDKFPRPRLGVALAPVPLDAATLADAPSYRTALERLVR